jgi:hypothetical protein
LVSGLAQSFREHAIIVSIWSSAKHGEMQPHFPKHSRTQCIYKETTSTHFLLRTRQLSVQCLESFLVWLVQRSTISFSPVWALQTASPHLHEHCKSCVEEVIAGTLHVCAVAPLLGHHRLEKIRRRSRVCKQVHTTACWLRAIEGIAVDRFF